MSPEATATARTPRHPEATRQALLEAAFAEIYKTGFRGASLDAILAESGVTKGALYHHFGSKLGLGYAVVEERVRPLVHRRYIQPFRETEDPTEALKNMGFRMQQELMKTGILLLGCPVNNLVQEMSGIDEGFRSRLAVILDEWKETVAEGLRRGQADGTVRADIDPVAVATLYVASYQGACGFAKNAQDIGPFIACRQGLDDYIENLRPKPQLESSTQ